VPVETVDEVGRLSQGFNRMLERLSQADAQIRAFNQRLAGEIEAATRDLSEKNATLAQLNRLLNEMRLENASKVRLATLGQLAAQLAHEIGPAVSVSGHIQLALITATCGPRARRLEVRPARSSASADRARLPRFDAAAGTGAPTRCPAAGGGDRLGAARGRTRAPVTSRWTGWRGGDRPGPAAADRRQSAVERWTPRRQGARHRRRQTGWQRFLIPSATRDGRPDDLRRIFEPFYDQGRGKGTGAKPLTIAGSILAQLAADVTCRCL
jgi:hypothetical protein